MIDPADNLVLPFQLESSHLRGRAVRLGAALDLILHQHAYPAPIGHLLGEAVVLAVALAAALKYDGVFTLQAKGDGVVRLLVADVTSDGGVRAYAQFDKDLYESINYADIPAGIRLLGKGHMAFTCSLAGQEERYQGIVALEGATLAEAVQHYFRQSEQVPTGIMAAVDCDAHGRWRGGGLLVQRMPREGGVNVESATPEAEDWTRAMMLMGTCTPGELTAVDVTADALLYRLFHEEGVRVYDAQALRHQCRCSDTRVRGMLRSLPRAEIEALAVEGLVTVTCEFCNKTYGFDRPARDELYKDAAGLTGR
ncbi:MAG: Hsp33 family molecular chaperone HslO [Alphaproteobacteria bacterium]|nr:Hsp33 family molecular chaperone HslO [Alphaproteobacteria bacterium]